MEGILKYKFNDPFWLQLACTHKTCDRINNNETLETLGDLVLSIHVGSFLYRNDRTLTPGGLSGLKSVNVDNENLCRACYVRGMHIHLKHNCRSLDDRIQQLAKDLQDFKKHSNGQIDTVKELADFFEAVIGAVWMDSGEDMVRTGEVIDRFLAPFIVDAAYRSRPVQQLWGGQLAALNGLRETESLVNDVPACLIRDRNNDVYATGVYGGGADARRNRAAFAALKRLGAI